MIQVPRTVRPVKYEHERPVWHPPTEDRQLALSKNPRAYKETDLELHKLIRPEKRKPSNAHKRRLARVRYSASRVIVLRTLTPARIAYLAYLKSKHWKRIRNQKLDVFGPECNRCHSLRQIQVHHKVYRPRWIDTQIEDLEVLCRACHRKEHGIG